MDQIFIRDLRVEAIVGVEDAERAKPQILVVQVEISTPLGRAADTDDLASTLDYAGLVERVSTVVRSREARLLETVATRISDAVLEMEGVVGVGVEVRKETVPVAADVGGVGVRIERWK